MARTNNLVGFSTIELLTTVAVAGIVTAIALPNWRSWFPTYALNNAARQVQSELHHIKMRAAAENLRPDSNWQKMAIGALIDDFFQHQTELTRKVLGQSAGPAPLAGHAAVIAPLDAVLAEIRAAPAIDLAMLTVANRQFRALAAR